MLCLNDIEAFHDPTMSRSSSLAHFEPPTFLFRDTYFFNWLFFRTQLLLQSETRGYYSFAKEYYDGEPWQRFREALARTSAMCDEHRCRFRVAVFPFLDNLGPEYPFRPIHHRIMADCENLGIDTFDLDPTLFREIGRASDNQPVRRPPQRTCARNCRRGIDRLVERHG